jgi:hypothetical protein
MWAMLPLLRSSRSTVYEGVMRVSITVRTGWLDVACQCTACCGGWESALVCAASSDPRMRPTAPQHGESDGTKAILIQ